MTEIEFESQIENGLRKEEENYVYTFQHERDWFWYVQFSKLSIHYLLPYTGAVPRVVWYTFFTMLGVTPHKPCSLEIRHPCTM